MATILYARVSTNEQTIAHQQTQAKAAGFVFDQVIADNGVSGVTTKLIERAEGKRLFDVLRTGDTLVVRWVDRLGRDYADVCETIRTFMLRGVVIRTIINGMKFDGATKDPMQQAVRDALIGFMAAMSQAQAEATKEAQRAGIAHARANRAYKGRRPSYKLAHVEAVKRMTADGIGVTLIARDLGLTRQTVYRILENPAEAIFTAATWS
jgi:putative DNA-invertase from lambdoid prophage Rac